MGRHFTTYPRILAISPSTTGFGLAVIEGVNSLVAWEVKRVRTDLNDGCLKRIEKAITLYQPQIIVLEEGTECLSRIRTLTKRIAVVARKRDIKVIFHPRERLRRVFFTEGIGSKEALAQIVAARFPEELGRYLPPKRTVCEDYRLAMFTAVALALAHRKLSK